MAISIVHLGEHFVVEYDRRWGWALYHNGSVVSSSTRLKSKEDAVDHWSAILKDIFTDRDRMIESLDRHKSGRAWGGQAPGKETQYRTNADGWKRRR